MSSPLTRRSLIENSLAASLGTLWTGPPPASPNRWIAPDQVPADSFSVKKFGAKGDGSTDDARAFQSAIAAASRVNGLVAVPPSVGHYVIGSTITLAPGTRIEGVGGNGATLRLGGAAETMFSFIGTSEAEGLNVTLAHLTLASQRPGNGVAVRVRNFSGLFLRHVNLDHFNLGLWADWGIGVHLYGCGLVRNARALQVGGEDGPGGIRTAGRQADPFLDTVVVDACSFAQNGLDVNDMGSNRSLGGIVIRDSSFFEAYANPVPGKYLYIRLANRKGLTVCGNWFEGGQRARTFIYLGNCDHDGNPTGVCYGGAIFGNDFLQTGQTETVGVDVARCEAATVFGNCFEFAPGNSPIRLADSVGRNTVGQNSYVTYPDRLGYANPIAASPGKHQVLDPRLPATLGNELQVTGRVATAVATLAYGLRISTDAAVGNYFTIAVPDGKPFTIQDPANPIPGQQIVYDIRNTSGSAIGDITWGAAFELAGPFIKPASKKRRTISFYCDGVAWIETARASADI